MNTLTIEIDDVVGRHLYVYREFLSGSPCLLLCAITHRLDLDLDPRTVEVLQLSTEGAPRMRLRVKKAKCLVKVTTPDFTSTESPSSLRQMSERWWGTLDGHVIVKQKPSKRFEIEVGELTTSDLKNANEQVLTALWPVTPHPKAPWTYIWSAVGLAIKSQMYIDNVATIETLLLPKLESHDVAWANEPVEFWRLDGKKSNNAMEFSGERFSNNRPDGDTWPGTDGRKKLATCARRWRVFDTIADGFLDQAFAMFKEDEFVDLKLLKPSLTALVECPDESTDLTLPSDPALAADIWAVDEMQYISSKKFKHIPRGVVVTLLRESIRANIRWSKQGHRSVFDAALAHSSLSNGPQPHQLQRVSVTLTTPDYKRSGKAPVTIDWVPGSGLGPAVSQISSTPMKFASVAPTLDDRVTHQSGSIPPKPRWLAVAQGWIDLPELTTKAEAEETSKLLKATSYAAQALKGGVPLGEIGGPVGLSAWVVESLQEQTVQSSVRLRLTPNGIALELTDAVLVWRTPAWWVGENAASLIPDLSATFSSCFSSPDETPTALSEQLTQAIAEHFSSTLWVGLTDPKLLIDPGNAWVLAKNQAGTFLTLPKTLAANSTAWVSIKNAYLLNTRPNAGTQLSSLLLDNNRALTPLKELSPKALMLELSSNQLPSLKVHPFPNLEAALKEGKACGGEMFHPNIFGLGFLPAESKLQYRHGPQMLVDGWLRQHGGIGVTDEISAAALESVRPVDDVAIYKNNGIVQSDRFSAHSGFVSDKENLVIKGWLPGTEVAIKSLTMRYTCQGDEDPFLSLQIPIGKALEKDQIITIGSGVNLSQSGNMSIEHNDEVDKFWLESAGNAQVGNTGNFINFGQSLAVSPTSDRFTDGANKRWKQWGNAQREITEGTKNADRLTLTAYVEFGLDGMDEIWPIGVSLLDALLRSANGTEQPDDQVWDLVGTQGLFANAQAPCVGPFAILPVSLSECSRASVGLSVRVAPPSTNRKAALINSGGQMDLLLRLEDNGTWKVSSGRGTFDWKIPGSTLVDQGKDAAISLERVEGLVEMVNGHLRLTVTFVTLRTTIGALRFATDPELINVQRLDSGCFRVELTIKSIEDRSTGFSCLFSAVCECNDDGDNHWFVADSIPAPKLSWSGASGTLTLPFSPVRSIRLEGLKVHAASELADIEMELFQSSTTRWGGVLSDSFGNFAVAASIEVNQDGKTPKLTWTVRASALLDAETLFGRCDPPGQQVRADVFFICNGPLDCDEYKDLGSTLTGIVQFKNDFQLQSVQPASTFHHHICLVFDQLKLTDKGTLPAPTIDVFALHCLKDGMGNEVRFQQVHQVKVMPAKNGKPYLQLSCLILLSPASGEEGPPISSQIKLFGDPEIAIARAMESPDVIRGHVVRLAFRNAGLQVGLKVQDTSLVIAAEDQLRFFPRVSVPCIPNGYCEFPEIWHERGALAELLDPVVLDELAKLQRLATFSQGGLPVEQESLIDWSPVLSGKGVCTFNAALFTGEGLRLIPFVVGLVDVRTKLATPTVQALRLELLSLEPFGPHQPLTCISSALVNVTVVGGRSSVQDWARQEMKRLSSRGAAVVIVRGHPGDLQAVHRSFQVAATSDVEAPLELPELPTIASRYALAEATQRVRRTGWQGRMQTNTQGQFTIEALCSKPLVKDSESGRLTRIASAATWTVVLAAQRSTSGALTFGQSVNFQQDKTSISLPRTKWPIFLANKVKPQGVGYSVIAPVVDVTQWTVRPGDMLTCSFSVSGSTAVAGPAITFQLRSARGNNVLDDQTLSYKETVKAHWEGVDWLLHRVSSKAVVGGTNTDQSKALLLSIATVRDTLHVESDVVNASIKSGEQGAILNLSWRPRKPRTNQAGKLVEGYSYNDPILVGAFIKSSMPTLASVELALVTYADQEFAATDVSSVADILNNPAAWQDHPEKLKCLILRQWPEGLPEQTKANIPTSYDASIASKLRQLLDLTDVPPDGKKPWLLSVDSGAQPRMALVSRDDSGVRRVITAVRIVWLEASVAGQPERLMVVSRDRVIGYGDLSGKAELSVDQNSFIFNTTCFALDQQLIQLPLDLHAWRFGPGGGCTGRANHKG